MFNARLIIRKKFSPTIYPLARVGLHPLQTDRHTNRWTTTMPIAGQLLKYGRLKTSDGL